MTSLRGRRCKVSNDQQVGGLLALSNLWQALTLIMSCFVGSIFDSLRGMVAGISKEEARFGDAVGLDSLLCGSLRVSCVLGEIEFGVGRLLFSVALGPPPPAPASRKQWEAMTVDCRHCHGQTCYTACLVRPWTNIYNTLVHVPALAEKLRRLYGRQMSGHP